MWEDAFPIFHNLMGASSSMLFSVVLKVAG